MAPAFALVVAVLFVADCAQWRLLVPRPHLLLEPLFGLAKVTEVASPSATIHTWPVEGRGVFTNGYDLQGSLASGIQIVKHDMQREAMANANNCCVEL